MNANIILGAIAGSGKFYNKYHFSTGNGFSIEKFNFNVIRKMVNVEDKYTLLARPVESMSEEEISTLLKFETDLDTKDYKFASELYENDNRIFYSEKAQHNDWQWYDKYWGDDVMKIEQLFYLLSIGVLRKYIAEQLPINVEWVK